MKSIKILHKIPAKVYYLIVVLLTVPAYIFGRQLLILQSTSFIAIISKVTVNLMILFFLVGMWTDKFTKHMPKLKGWLIWAAVTLVLILFFKYVGGIETRW